MKRDSFWLIAYLSCSSDGCAFTLVATRPWYSSISVARAFGTVYGPVSSCTTAFGSATSAVTIPRGRWYLKLRATKCTPFASSADASVSPWKP